MKTVPDAAEPAPACGKEGSAGDTALRGRSPWLHFQLFQVKNAASGTLKNACSSHRRLAREGKAEDGS